MSDCDERCECKRGLTRRDVLRIGAGAAASGVALRGGRAFAAPGDIPTACRKPPGDEWFAALFERGEPPTYRGEALKHVALPLGGIGTGTIWLHGSGRLTNWQIFNNIDRSSQVDDTFFAVRVQPEDGSAVVRALQQASVGPFPGMANVTFTGQYPFAFVDFDDPALAAHVRLEAFNPMIPLNDQDSAIPCAIFRIVATNRSAKPIRVSFLASAQNAVGHQGRAASVGVGHATYGRNVNRLVDAGPMRAVRMGAEPGTPAELSTPLTAFIDHGPLEPHSAWPVRNLTVRSVASRMSLPHGRSLIWLAKGDLGRMGGGPLAAVAEAVENGATLVVSGVANPLLGEVKSTTSDRSPRDEETFEDFEGPSYRRWKIEGTAFGERPSQGTEPQQSLVSGFLGGGLVNTFRPNDRPHGTATSPSFRIDRRYITFLIGGGNKPGKCCLNLRIDGKAVRTATGKDSETLERQQWDVQEYLGRDAVLEIVDRSSVGWGHILVDDIRFSNMPSEAITEREAAAWNALLPATFPPAAGANSAVREVTIDRDAPDFVDVTADRVRFAAPAGRAPTRKQPDTRTLLSFDDGAPAVLARDVGKGRVFVIPADLDPAIEADPMRRRDAWLSLLAGLAGVRFEPAAGRPDTAPSYGTMCLATPDTSASCMVGWQDRDRLYGEFETDGVLDEGPERVGPTPAGRTINAALATGTEIRPGGQADATFVLTWHFPNQYYPQAGWRITEHNALAVGNMYANWFRDAETVATYVLTGLDRLRDATERYRAALYDDSTLPHYFVDCAGANASILRSPTCFWTKDDTFYGFEGCKPNAGCCPMNCNHVWNYEQTLAHLWPALERNMRITELVYNQYEDGGVRHRVGVPRDKPRKGMPPVADGQCGAVLKMYREHRQGGDDDFLRKYWPRIRKAMDFAISHWDADADGVMEKPQFNTYDREIFGKNSFVSSLYLAALRAAEEMARLVDRDADADRYCNLFESGRDWIASNLFNGEYYIQIAGDLTGGYGKGCWSDQVVGQWWARLLDLGDILPDEQVQAALRAIFRYSWLWRTDGFEGTQRFLQFSSGADKCLLCGSWPKGGRPDDPIYYRDEAWTGVEYQVAAHKVYEGQLREALTIVKGARQRYDGTKRNPWDEIECGDYYARAMSSWSLLLAAQGFSYDGPKGRLGFAPRLLPEDHRSFFATADGWGVFAQRRGDRSQSNALDVRYGRCTVRTLTLAPPADVKPATVEVALDDEALSPTVTAEAGRVQLAFAVPKGIEAESTLAVTMTW
jgi:non-lysosomal glucosylceramidase